MKVTSKFTFNNFLFFFFLAKKNTLKHTRRLRYDGRIRRRYRQTFMVTLSKVGRQRPNGKKTSQ